MKPGHNGFCLLKDPEEEAAANWEREPSRLQGLQTATSATAFNVCA